MDFTLWDNNGQNYTLSIELPADRNWYMLGWEVGRFGTAALSFEAWDEAAAQSVRELRVVDLDSGSVLAGRSLAADEYLISSWGPDSLFHIVRVEGGQLNVTAYSHARGVDAASLQAPVGAGVTLTLPEGWALHGNVWVDQYIPPQADGAAYLLGRVWNAETASSTAELYRAMPDGTTQPVALPGGTWGHETWHELHAFDGRLWLHTYNNASGEQAFFRLDPQAGSDWQVVDGSLFWEIDQWLTGWSGQLWTRGETLDLLAEVPPGYMLDLEDDGIFHLPDGQWLVRAEAYAEGRASYDQWLLLDASGQVLARHAFSSQSELPTRTVYAHDDNLYFQQLNASFDLDGMGALVDVRQDDAPALTLYRIDQADVASVLIATQGQDLTAHAKVTKVAEYSLTQLGLQAPLPLNQLVTLDQYLPLETGDVLLGYRTQDAFSDEIADHIAVLRADGSPVMHAAVPGSVYMHFLDVTQEHLLLLLEDDDGESHAFRMGLESGELTDLPVQEFWNIWNELNGGYIEPAMFVVAEVLMEGLRIQWGPDQEDAYLASPALVKTVDGEYGLTMDRDVAPGVAVDMTPLLNTSGDASWQPPEGAEFIASYYGGYWNPETGEYVSQRYLLERAGTNSEPVFRQWGFEALDYGEPIKAISEQPTVLSTSEVLELEINNQLDLNRDGLIGDPVAEILLQGRVAEGQYTDDEGNTHTHTWLETPTLVKTHLGYYGLTRDWEAEEGVASWYTQLQTSSGSKWVPASGTEIVGAFWQVTELGDGVFRAEYGLVERSGTASKPVFKLWRFDDTAEAAGARAIGSSARTLTQSELLALEATHELDLNGDDVIGDAVSEVLKCVEHDFDEDGISNYNVALVKLVSGAYGVIASDSPVGAGTSEPATYLQTSAGKPWVPTSKTTIAGVYLSESDTDDSTFWRLVEKSGSASKPVFKLWSFAIQDDGLTAKATGNSAVTLDLPRLLWLEWDHGQDFNGDGFIGDAIAAVLYESPENSEVSLVRLTSGVHGLVLGETAEVGVATEVLQLQTSAGKPWVPTSKTEIVGIYSTEPDSDIGIEQWHLVERSGSASKPVFKQWTFSASYDDLTAKMIGKSAVTLDLPHLLALEWDHGQDFNGDGFIGDAIAGILYESAGDAEISLVHLTSGAHGLVLGEAAQIGVAAEILQLQTSAGKPWVPTSKAEIVALYSSEPGSDVSIEQWHLVEKSGSASKPVFKEWTFTTSSDGMIAKANGKTATTLDLPRLLALELELGLDLNGDQAIGDAVAQVLSVGSVDVDSDGLADYSTASLVKLTSGAHALLIGEAAETGMVAETLQLQSSTGKPWAPTSKTSITGIYQSERLAADGSSIEQWHLVEKGGSASKPVFKLWTFTASDDGLSAKAAGKAASTLDLAYLLALEPEQGQDFNGDGSLGDAITQIVRLGSVDLDGDSQVDYDTASLVMLTSGAYALTSGEAAIGEVTDTLLLQTSAGKPWVPTSKTTITGIYQSERQVADSSIEQWHLVEKSGTASKPVFKLWTFIGSDDAALARASAKAASPLTAQAVLDLEVEYQQDFNGDSRIEAPAIALVGLAGDPLAI